jgi:hypothetical protein
MKQFLIRYQITDDNGVIIEEQNVVIEATEETILKLKQLTQIK